MTESLPGWQNRLLAMVHASEATSVKRAERPSLGNVRADPEFRVLLNRAARARDISVQGYMRRALAKQIAKDLGMDWRQILAFCAAPAPWGKAHKAYSVRGPDDGEGYGDWDD